MKDRDLAKMFGVKTTEVRAVREALGVRTFREWVPVSEPVRKRLLERLDALRRFKVPKENWASLLWFDDLPNGLTKEDCLKEWLFCHKKKLTYDPVNPRIPSLATKTRRFRGGFRIPEKLPKLHKVDPSALDDEGFEVGQLVEE